MSAEVHLARVDVYAEVLADRAYTVRFEVDTPTVDLPPGILASALVPLVARDHAAAGHDPACRPWEVPDFAPTEVARVLISRAPGGAVLAAEHVVADGADRDELAAALRGVLADIEAGR